MSDTIYVVSEKLHPYVFHDKTAKCQPKQAKFAGDNAK